MNIGVILPTLDNNQLAIEVITTINHELANGSKHDYRIFFENLSNYIMMPHCAVMNITELWNCDGLIVTTNLYSTKLATKAIGNKKIVFIVWDLEWLRHEKNYIENLEIYRNPNIILLARSNDHAKAIYNYSNRKPNGIMEGFNFLELANAIR